MFLNKVWIPSETHIIYLSFPCKLWMSTKFVRLELSQKNFTFTQTRRYNTKFCDQNETTILRVDVTFEWYEDVMVFGVFIFIFLFRTNGKKRHLDENDFRTIIVVTPKCHSESYLIAAMFKVPSQELWGTMTTVLWKTPYSWRFYRQGSRYIVTISSRLE